MNIQGPCTVLGSIQADHARLAHAWRLLLKELKKSEPGSRICMAVGRIERAMARLCGADVVHHQKTGKKS